MKKAHAGNWYPVIVERDEDGFFVASNPALSGCHSQGKTVEEALANVREATELCLADTQESVRTPEVSVHLITA